MRPARILRFGFTFIAMLGMLFGTLVATVSAATVTYSGQGTTIDLAGDRVLNTEICGVVNGAPMDGPYLLWVFSGGGRNGATAVSITGPWDTAPMAQDGGGAFKFVSDWYDLDTLVGAVSANYNGSPTNPQLVISHGCAPQLAQWCSPGYWRNNTTMWPVPLETTFFEAFGYEPVNKDNAEVPGTTLLEMLLNPQTFNVNDQFNLVADYLSSQHSDINWTGERYLEDGSHDCPLPGDGNDG